MATPRYPPLSPAELEVPPLPARPLRLLDRVRQRLRVLHYSHRTEVAYVGWIRRYVLHHGRRHPAELGGAAVDECLAHLATVGRVLARGQIVVRQGKSDRDRAVPLGLAVSARLRGHLSAERARWEREAGRAGGSPVPVPLPGALARKLPGASREWMWQWVFPARRVYVDREGRRWRLHLHPSAVQRAVTAAARRARVTARVTCHAFRHSFATHLLESGTDIRTIQETARASGPAHDDDLHARARSRCVGGAEPRRSTVAAGCGTDSSGRHGGRAVAPMDGAAMAGGVRGPDRARPMHAMGVICLCSVAGA